MSRTMPPSFDFYPDDFSAGTDYFTPAQAGVYFRLLMYQFRHGFIPADQDQWGRVLGPWQHDETARLAMGFVVSEKFVQTNEGFVNERMAFEREKKLRQRDINIANGRKGGRPKKLRDENSKNPRLSFRVTQKKPKANRGEEGSMDLSSLSLEKERTSKAGTLPELPACLDTDEYRCLLALWLAYKTERGESYKPIGLRQMISRTERLVKSHGLPAVMGLMERAMANDWKGWDHDLGTGNGVTSTLSARNQRNADRAKRLSEQNAREHPHGQSNGLR